jgi:two-component system, chemotaxis family, chemotaxis protein CheY
VNLSEFLGDFQLEAGEKLDIIASQLLLLERDPTKPQPVREMFLAVHTIKGGAAMLRLADVEVLAHGIEELLSAVRDHLRTLDGPTADLLFQAIDHLRDAIARAEADAPGAEPDPAVADFARLLHANPGDAAQASSSGSEVRQVLSLPKALLVDGSPTVCELHRMLLQDAGFEVDVCDSGQVALARALARTFDLIVAGLQNKGKGGIDLVLALRANPAYRDVPMILTTADTDPDLTARAAECGARALVRKGSLQDEQLSELLRELGRPLAA